MVKLTGPGLAKSASGSIAGLLTFQTSGRRTFARKKPKPKNPKSALQVSTRAVQRFITRSWQNSSEADQATWNNLAQQNNVTPYHAYLGHNLTRWANFKGPSRVYPAAEDTAEGTAGLITTTGGTRHVNVSFRNYVMDTLWGYLLFRSKTFNFPLSKDTLIHIFVLPEPTTHYYHDGPLEPGTYYYRLQELGINGLKDYVFSQRTATVT